MKFVPYCSACPVANRHWKALQAACKKSYALPLRAGNGYHAFLMSLLMKHLGTVSDQSANGLGHRLSIDAAWQPAKKKLSRGPKNESSPFTQPDVGKQQAALQLL
eukprot:661763-Pelagomonas_calceolata.AAC.10